MFKEIAGIVSGKKYYYCQIASAEEREKYNVPENIFFWWEDEDGNRIFSPMQIMNMVIETVPKNETNIQTFLESPAVHEFHKSVVEEQKNRIIEALENAKREYEKIGQKEAVDNIRKTIEEYEKVIEGIHAR